MFIALSVILCVTIVVRVLKVISIFTSEKVILSREELTSYECGFEFKSSARLPFSFRYFLLTLVFLIFDLELIFLVFLPLKVFVSFQLKHLVLIAFFMVILILGLVYEWLDGALE